VAKNDVERSWLTKYKTQIESLNADQDELTRIRKEIHQARFGKGGNRSQLTKLENQAKILADRITKADKKLLMLEASKPLQGVVERERAKAYQLGKEKLVEYRKERAESAALHYYRPRIEKIVGDCTACIYHQYIFPRSLGLRSDDSRQPIDTQCLGSLIEKFHRQRHRDCETYAVARQ
jgi:hypothetical protein